MKVYTLRSLAFCMLILCAVLLMVGTFFMAAPSITHAQLPPRPTLTPTPSPTPLSTPLATARPVDNPVRIRLAVPAYEGAWSLVQWQDSAGGWHDVDGWQGEIEAGQKQWRVSPKDFDTGPFRWLVMDQPNGEILAISDPFLLPTRAEPLRVITLGDEPMP